MTIGPRPTTGESVSGIIEAERPPFWVSRPSVNVENMALAPPAASVKKLNPPGPVRPAEEAIQGPEGSDVQGPTGVEHLAIPVE